MRTIILTTLAALVLPATTVGQATEHHPHVLGPELGLEAHLFQPDAVIRHERAIELSDEQKQAILAATEQFEQEGGLAVALAYRSLLNDIEAALEGSAVDEDTTLAAAARLLAVETELKLSHLRLLIQVKNTLTEVQQRRLRELVQSSHSPRPPAPTGAHGVQPPNPPVIPSPAGPPPAPPRPRGGNDG